MKKIITAAFILLCLNSSAQTKKAPEKTQVAQMDTASFNLLYKYVIGLIDSKKETQAFIEFLQKNVRIIDIDKPKEQVKP